MNLQDQYLACAELDGCVCRQALNAVTFAIFTQDGERITNWHDTELQAWLKLSEEGGSDYSTRDALVGVIEKQNRGTAFIFLHRLYEIITGHYVICDAETEWGPMVTWSMMTATPDQLREALLKATGKWKE